MNFQVEKFRGAHLLVAGEVGIDEYIWGDTCRISPEAPVPVIEVESQSTQLGLAGNVAHNIVSLGGQVTLVAMRGVDADGERLASMVTDAGIAKAVLIPDSSRPTLRKVRVIARKQHVVRVDYEKSHPLDVKLAKTFTDSLCDLLPHCDGVIVQDYGKGIWNPDTMQFARYAKEKKKPIFVDPSRTSPLSLYRGTTLLTPNLVEAEILCGMRHESSKVAGQNDLRLTGLAKKMLETTEAEHAIITCGEWGMVSLTRGSSSLVRIPTFAQDVFDVTGAGDTVISVLSLMYVLGEDLSRAMQVSNAAAGLVVGKVGAATVTPQELTDELVRLYKLGLLSE